MLDSSFWNMYTKGEYVRILMLVRMRIVEKDEGGREFMSLYPLHSSFMAWGIQKKKKREWFIK